MAALRLLAFESLDSALLVLLFLLLQELLVLDGFDALLFLLVSFLVEEASLESQELLCCTLGDEKL